MPKQRKLVKKLTRKNLRSHMASVVILVAFCLIIVLPENINQGIDWINKQSNLGVPNLPQAGFNLGLDLQGGAHLVYQADTSLVPASDRTDSVEGVRDVIERRVRGGLGVSEPMVQTTKVGKDYRVIVELPGIKDVNKAIEMIGETPILEFKEENQEPARALTDEERQEMSDYNKNAKEKADKALGEAKKIGADFAELAKIYSEDQLSNIKGGDLGFVDGLVFPELYDWANKAKDGEISKELIESTDGLNIVKRLSSRISGKEIKASHLLICYKGAEKCDTPIYNSAKEAKEKILEIKKEFNGSNFVELAKKYSTEPGASERAGDLGWFGKGVMVPEFEEAVFAMKKGQLSDPVETQFGYHLIYKEDERNKNEYQIARIYLKTKSATDIVPPAEQWKNTGLSGKQLKRAEVAQDSRTSQIQVSLNFDSEGSKLFADITTKNVGKTVAIFLDGQPISVPRVNEPILSGSAVISGDFGVQEAQLLARRLNSGALPVPVKLISQQKVDATLGVDSLQKSFKAAVLGLLLVILFMIIYYRAPGIISAFALGIYGVLALAIFKLIGVTLTLSGIAGFILSLGMAVDANVLIFERLKEELRSGRSLRPSIEDAFKRAWPSIRDGNITTLISCVFLIWFGSGFVQGFAVTLAIGVLSSMFSSIIICKVIMRITSYWVKEEANLMFLGYKKEKK
ncbi:MAG: protein translocase subunit SecD [bacterium]